MGIGADHRVTANLQFNASAEDLIAWLSQFPGKARISAQQHAGDRNEGPTYSLTASWHDPGNEQKIGT